MLAGFGVLVGLGEGTHCGDVFAFAVTFHPVLAGARRLDIARLGEISAHLDGAEAATAGLTAVHQANTYMTWKKNFFSTCLPGP